MSTTQKLSPQVYAQDGTPIPPAVSREHLLDLTRDAYEHAGTHLERGDVDIELAEVADKAACSLLRDRWNDDFPIAAYTELLTAIAALRAVHGFDPTPTAREVLDWAERLGNQLGEGLEGPTSRCYVQFLDGPYRGAVLAVPQSLRMGDMGPAAALTLPIAWGDTADPGRGEVRYQRSPAADRGTWLYRLDGDVREDARPHITVPSAPTEGGRA
ncbi:RsbRD N-terminal domain-containing protein [Streptomyces ardesiacus]|uniref:RsbRD N-terminal domain-containing protein n=1 Tax=Streptomyces ardesiacus TaxID=285564 RepID=UPI0033F5E6AE